MNMITKYSDFTGANNITEAKTELQMANKKDLDFVKNLVDKRGDESAKYALQIAEDDNDPIRSHMRSLAAIQLGYIELSKIFSDRAKTLGYVLSGNGRGTEVPITDPHELQANNLVETNERKVLKHISEYTDTELNEELHRRNK